jgi:serralysin
MKRFILPILLAFASLLHAAEPKHPAPCGCVAIDADKLHSPIAQVFRLFGDRSKLWPQGATLRVKFIEGNKGQQDRAWQRFQKVDALVNLTFVKVTAGQSDIRVGFGPYGHFSYLGRDATTISQRDRTFNAQLSTWDSVSEWDRVVIHEVCHAIGIDHEQAHPSAQIPWNKPAVYAYYLRTQRWSKAQTDRQVLERYTGPNFIGSAYDKDSIKQYAIDRSHVLDPRFAVGSNTKLSRRDIETLRDLIYPAILTP